MTLDDAVEQFRRAIRPLSPAEKRSLREQLDAQLLKQRSLELRSQLTYRLDKRFILGVGKN